MTLTITSVDEPDAKTQLAASLASRVKPKTSEKLRAKALTQPRDPSTMRFLTALSEQAVADDADDLSVPSPFWLGFCAGLVAALATVWVIAWIVTGSHA